MLIAVVLGTSLLCLAIFWSVTFILAKSMVRDFGYVSHQLLGCQPPTVALQLTSWACALLVLIFVPMKGCSHMQVELCRQAIPPQFELVEALHHDEIEPPRVLRRLFSLRG